MERFIKLVRQEDSELLRHMIRRNHNAFILLTVIANRARRSAEPHPVTGRKQFEAEVGDYEEYGLSRQQYRTALVHLERWKIITIKPTTKGTIVKLINMGVFDINPEGSNHQGNQLPTISQPSSNHQPTTKKNEKNEKNGRDNSASSDAPSPDSPSKSYVGLSGDRLKRFEEFWAVFNYKSGKAATVKAWKNLGSISDELFQEILSGAKREASGRDARREAGLTPKMAQGWLTDRRWEDEPEAVGQDFGKKTRGGDNRFGLSDADLLT